jgi:hypothetical protein
MNRERSGLIRQCNPEVPLARLFHTNRLPRGRDQPSSPPRYRYMLQLDPRRQFSSVEAHIGGSTWEVPRSLATNGCRARHASSLPTHPTSRHPRLVLARSTRSGQTHLAVGLPFSYISRETRRRVCEIGLPMTSVHSHATLTKPVSLSMPTSNLPHKQWCEDSAVLAAISRNATASQVVRIVGGRGA